MRILAAILAVLGIAGAAVFGTKYQSSQAESKTLEDNVSSLQEEKTQLEKDLIFYKNTDLAKDNELLRVKLENAEEDLTAARSRVTVLETNLNKIEPYTDVISAIERFLSAPFTKNGLADIETKVSALGDAEVSNRWATARATVDFANNGWGPHDFFQAVFF